MLGDNYKKNNKNKIFKRMIIALQDKLRLKLKTANNWAGVSRSIRVNCKTNCDWIVIVRIINALIILLFVK
jgi:hypothetical protein